MIGCHYNNRRIIIFFVSDYWLRLGSNAEALEY